MNRMKFSGCVRTGVVALAAVFGFGAAAEEADVRASADYLRRTAGKDVRYPVLLDSYNAQPIMTAAQKSPFGDDAFVRSLGYTGRIALGGTTALTFDKYAPNVVRRGSDARAWIEARQVTCAKEYEQFRRGGLEVIMSFDILVVPETLLTLYKSEMTDDQGRISIRRPRTREVFRAMLDELFERFPDVDGVMTRFGETYCHMTPYHTGMSPAHSAADHAEVVKLLRDEVCVKRGKKLFYRTWDFGFLHTHRENYLAASDPVEPHPLLYYAVKHSNADFLRDYPFNETVGVGRHQQIVEVSMNQAGVYGKNAYPYYFAKGILDGFNDDDPKTRFGIRALKDKPQVKGFWLWQYGDGWEGPYAPHELWLRLNEAVIRGSILKPEATEEELFASVATNVCGVDRRDLARFREFCLLSEDAVYFGQHTKKTQVCEWWNRDNYFASVDLAPAVREGRLEEVLKEKTDNISNRWKKMEELIAGVRFADPKAAEFARVSTTYGRIRYEVGALVWKLDGYLTECRVAGKAPEKARARELSDEFDAKWREWEDFKAANPRMCPTLYRISSQQKHYSPPLFCRSLAKLRAAAGFDDLYPYGEELFGQ